MEGRGEEEEEEEEEEGRTEGERHKRRAPLHCRCQDPRRIHLFIAAPAPRSDEERGCERATTDRDCCWFGGGEGVILASLCEYPNASRVL